MDDNNNNKENRSFRVTIAYTVDDVA